METTLGPHVSKERIRGDEVITEEFGKLKGDYWKTAQYLDKGRGWQQNRLNGMQAYPGRLVRFAKNRLAEAQNGRRADVGKHLGAGFGKRRGHRCAAPKDKNSVCIFARLHEH